ncbi:MAG TPA: hypothetical protein VFV35_07490 [Acidimicrobiales bacterium]|nr:hypothetical protein [Acidimicrobiales bacterium]
MTSTTTIPAIAGAAQTIQRPGEWTEPAEAKGPIELMVEAARAAADDAGAPSLLDAVQWVGVIGGAWRYKNPAQLVARELGVPNAKTALTMYSGSSPQDLVGVAAEKIAAGEIEVALIVGGEATWSERRIAASGAEPSWISEPGEGEPEMYSLFAPEMMAEAATFGGASPAYALFEDSLRASLGLSMDAHRDRISALWERFSAVAAANPYAWDRTPHSASEIREPTPENRMIVFPYTKAMVANNTVNQASAVLLCSLDHARSKGISTDGFVFPHVVTTSHETWEVARRNQLHGAPAVTAAGRAALDHVGIGVDDIAHVDLYACFPSIVQMSAAALGFDLERPLTVTGGLGFCGAPLANSSGLAIAAMVPLVRQGGWGFVHANGGFATKHAFGIYSSDAPGSFVKRDCQDQVDDNAREPLATDWEGKGTVEAATVVYDRSGPSHLLATVLDADGKRAFARSTDASTIEAAERGELTGSAAERAADGSLRA